MSMTQEQFREMWDQLFEESLELAHRRTELENDLNEVRARMENVEQTLTSIQPLAGITVGDNLRGLGMTDAIRAVIQKSKQRMSATDVRNLLENGGFDLSGYSSPLSSIYTVLRRISDDGSGDVLREHDGTRNVFYRWKTVPPQSPEPTDEYAQSAEISDDDIPF